MPERACVCRTVLFLLLTIVLTPLKAQWEAGVARATGSSYDWRQRQGMAGLEPAGQAAGYSLSLGRSFDASRIRLSVGPGLRFSRLERSYRTTTADDRTGWSGHTLAGLYLQTRLYFLDLQGNCDCPTFSRRGSDALKKGMFVQLVPQGGLSWHRFVSAAADPERAMHWQLAGGIGWDLPLPGKLVVTPLLQAAGTRLQYPGSGGPERRAGGWEYRLGIQFRLQEPGRP